MSFPTEPKARLAVASYPFRAFMDSPHNRDRDKSKPGMTLIDFARMVPEKFGVNGIEPLDDHFLSLDPGYLNELRAAFDKAGVHVVNIPVAVHPSLGDPDAEKRNQAVAVSIQWMEAAKVLGAPGVRLHIAPVSGKAVNAELAAGSLRECCQWAAAHDLHIALENDDPSSEDPYFIVKVIEIAKHPRLYSLPDFCNSRLLGDDDYNYKALRVLFPLAYHISHVKDSESDNGKIFRVDPAKVFAIAKEAKYRGYFSMEWEGETEPYEGTRQLIAQSLKALA